MTIEKAERELSLLISLNAEIERLLGSKNNVVDGRRLNIYEYEKWRQKSIFNLNENIKTLRAVKAWIKNYHTNPDIGLATADAKTVNSALTEFRRGVNDFCDFVLALEEENKRLAAENAGMRSTIARLTQTQIIAPGDGVDVWRDGYTSVDKGGTK